MKIVKLLFIAIVFFLFITVTEQLFAQSTELKFKTKNSINLTTDKYSIVPLDPKNSVTKTNIINGVTFEILNFYDVLPLSDKKDANYLCKYEFNETNSKVKFENVTSTLQINAFVKSDNVTVTGMLLSPYKQNNTALDISASFKCRLYDNSKTYYDGKDYTYSWLAEEKIVSTEIVHFTIDSEAPKVKKVNNNKYITRKDIRGGDFAAKDYLKSFKGDNPIYVDLVDIKDVSKVNCEYPFFQAKGFFSGSFDTTYANLDKDESNNRIYIPLPPTGYLTEDEMTKVDDGEKISIECKFTDYLDVNLVNANTSDVVRIEVISDFNAPDLDYEKEYTVNPVLIDSKTLSVSVPEFTDKLGIAKIQYSYGLDKNSKPIIIDIKKGSKTINLTNDFENLKLDDYYKNEWSHVIFYATDINGNVQTYYKILIEDSNDYTDEPIDSIYFLPIFHECSNDISNFSKEKNINETNFYKCIADNEKNYFHVFEFGFICKKYLDTIYEEKCSNISNSSISSIPSTSSNQTVNPKTKVDNSATNMAVIILVIVAGFFLIFGMYLYFNPEFRDSLLMRLKSIFKRNTPV